MLGAILAALQTYLRYSERAEKHRIAAAKFAALHKEVDQLLVIPLGDEKTLSDSMSSIRTRWDEISEGSPTIPESIWKKHKAIFDKGP